MRVLFQSGAHILAIAATIATVGCASITDGTTQTIIFTLDPPDTRCVATRVGEGELGAVTRSQVTLLVGKDKDDIILTCKAPGHDDKVMRIVSKTQASGVVGGIFLDLGITDMITGAMWKYPGEVNVALDPVASATTASAPDAMAKAALVAPAQDNAAAQADAAAPAAVPQRAIGQGSSQVERMPEVKTCHPQAQAVLVGKGPSSETYSVACTAGDVLTIRCELGVCRVLK